MLLLAILAATGCGQGVNCQCLDPDPPYSLVIRESDSGQTGVMPSVGGVAFVLDPRRDRMFASGLPGPVYASPNPRATPVTELRPTTIAGRTKAFVYSPENGTGIATLKASGAGLAPFTYRLVIADTVLQRGLNVVRPGQIVAQASDSAGTTEDATSGAPLLTAITGWTAPGLQGRVNAGPVARPPWRAMRAGGLGAVRIPGAVVVVADPPGYPTYFDGSEGTLRNLSGGSWFTFVTLGDDVGVDVSSSLPGAVERLPDSAAGPRVPGATMVPLRMRLVQSTTLSLTTSSGQRFELTISMNPGCVPTDFPLYPDAHQVKWQSAGQSPCSVEWQTSDSESVATKTSVSLLNQGDWTVTSHTGGVIHFRRRSRGQVSGTVTVRHNSLGETFVAVDLRM